MSKRSWIESLSRKVLKSVINRKLAILVGALLFALCSTVQAQPQGKSPARVGWLWYGSATAGPLRPVLKRIIDGVPQLLDAGGTRLSFADRRVAGGRGKTALSLPTPS